MFGSKTTRSGDAQLDNEALLLYKAIVEHKNKLDELQKTEQSLEHDKKQFTDKHIETVNRQKSLFEDKMSEERNTFAEKSSEEEEEFKQHLLVKDCQIATFVKRIKHIRTELQKLTEKVEGASQPDQTTGKPSSTASQYTIFLNDYR